MGWFIAPGTFGLLAEYFLKGTIILTLALFAAAASKRRPASFRHFVLSFALIGQLLLPLLSVAPIGWRTSLLPARPAERETQEPAVEFSNARQEVGEVSEMKSSTAEGNPARSLFGLSVLVEVVRPGSALFSQPSDNGSVRLPDGRRGSRTNKNFINTVIAVIWSLGLAFLLLRLALGLAGAVKLTSQSKALGDPVWRVLLDRFLSLVSLKRSVRLKSHPEVFVPLTWGWRKPVVLMPAGADAWTEEERSSALFHELSHVKRADFLVMLLVRAGLAIFWWNPLCWIIYRELRKEQEIACDELVLRTGIRPSTYAASLLAFRRSAGFRWNPSAALLGMLGRSSFNERLAAILKQKLTFKEVKMKTKIMLAAAVILAVAAIGTARPAVGTEETALASTVVETAVPAPVSLDIALPAAEPQETQAEKEAAQEKEKEKAQEAEKEKEKEVIERKIVIAPKEGEKTPIEITITEGDKVKKLVLEKPLTITLGKDRGVLVISSDGKEIQALKGEPFCLEIKSGRIELLKEGKVLKLGEGGICKVIKEGIKEGVKITVQAEKESKPTIAFISEEPDKCSDIKLAKKYSVRPHVFTITREKDLLEKVRQIREQAAAVKEKKLDFATLEKSLEKLEAELKASEGKLIDVGIELDEEPGEFTVIKKIREGEEKGGVWIAEGGEPKSIIKVVTKDGGSILISMTGKPGKEGREAYDRAVAKLKKDLPEGYVLEPSFDENSGAMTFKINVPEGKKADEGLVHKVVENLKEEVKK
jgi:beta-lactamase regulating signal transducer with metallopeptidase domain